VDPQAAASGARLIGETVTGGFHVTYEELPFEWTWPRRFGVLRRYRGGPLVSLSTTWALDEDGDRTRMTVTFVCQPRVGLLRPVAWLNLQRAAAAITGLGEQIDAYVRRQGPNPYAQPVSPSAAAAVERGVADLVSRGVRPELAARLGLLLRAAPDADCVRIRPFALADDWSEPRREVLAAFLHAVSAGLVELSWSVICPSCVTQAEALASLSELGPDGHCDLCDIRFGIALDEAVEASFHPNSAVRRSAEQLFCAAGPGRTPHVLVQANVAPGEQVDLSVPVEPGRYRLFVRGGARVELRVEPEGPAEVVARFDDGAAWPEALTVGPAGRLRVRNDGAETRHVKLERLVFLQKAATAHEVSTLPEFRSLFSKEILKPGTPLRVTRATLMFTDLTGSTALYAELGDATAFRLVDDHFDLLREIVSRTGGVLVKTMGDAVMAAYADERAGLHGAVAVLEAFERFRRESPLGERVHIKVGLHSGPSYVVTANGALDYFGQTVNVASRLQHLAIGGEIVVEAALWSAVDPADRLGLRASDPFSVLVRGVTDPMRLVRLSRAAEGQDLSGLSAGASIVPI
jgi:class 3 adenylate cyclase